MSLDTVDKKEKVKEKVLSTLGGQEIEEIKSMGIKLYSSVGDIPYVVWLINAFGRAVREVDFRAPHENVLANATIRLLKLSDSSYYVVFYRESPPAIKFKEEFASKLVPEALPMVWDQRWDVILSSRSEEEVERKLQTKYDIIVEFARSKEEALEKYAKYVSITKEVLNRMFYELFDAYVKQPSAELWLTLKHLNRARWALERELYKVKKKLEGVREPGSSTPQP